MAFTEELTFSDLKQEPLMASLIPYFLSKRKQGLMETAPQAKLKDHILDAFNMKEIADGFNYLVELQKKGVPVLQHFYSQEECQADPTREGTGLFWFPAKAPGPFLLLCPGGGYDVVEAMVEGFPVAKALNQMGINVFSLKYRVGMPGAAKLADEDLAAAIRHILAHRDFYHVTEDYALMGFSAGGHLVCGFGTENRGYGPAGLPKPQMIGACYAVVFPSPGEDPQRRRDWARKMTGDGDVEQALSDYAPLLHVGPGFPPAYIWHTLEDAVVSPDNARQLAARLEELGIPYRLNLVPTGPHGLGLGTGTDAEGWLPDAVAFWNSLRELSR